MQSDVDAPKKAKEDLTNQGTAVVSNGKLDLVDPQPTHAGADANPALSPGDILAENRNSPHKDAGSHENKVKNCPNKMNNSMERLDLIGAKRIAHQN